MRYRGCNFWFMLRAYAIPPLRKMLPLSGFKETIYWEYDAGVGNTPLGMVLPILGFN